MIRLKIVNFIVLCCLAFTSAQQPPQCDDQMPNVGSMKPSFGGIDAFYSMSKGISDGLQSTPDSKTYNDLNDVIFARGGATYNQVIKDMVVNQIGAIIFWSVGFVLVLAALVLGVATAIWQSCYSCVPKESSSRSKIPGYIYAFLLFTTFALTLTGTILFNITETNLVDSVDNAVVYTTQITSDLKNVLNTGSNQLSCQVNTTTTAVFSNTTQLLNGYSDAVVGGTSDQVGLTAVNNFPAKEYEKKNTDTINSADALGAALNSDSVCKGNPLANQIPLVKDELNSLSAAAEEIRVNQQLVGINQEVATIKGKINDQTKQASNGITNSQKTISDTVQRISNMLDNIQSDVDNAMNSVQSAHRDVVNSGGYSAVQIVLRIVVTIPAVLGCLFSLFALVAILLSLKNQDGIAVKLATWVLVAFYISIILSIILLLVSSLAFVFGWFMSAMCVPIFEDPDYHLFHLMNQTIEPQTGSNLPPDVVNIGGVLTSCQDSDTTIYNAINGSNIISADSISKQLNMQARRDDVNKQIMEQKNETFSYPQDYIGWQNLLNTQLEAAQKVDTSPCSSNVRNAYDVYISNLKVSANYTSIFIGNLQTLSQNAQIMTTIAQAQNNEQFDKGDAYINSSITDLLTSLNTNVFKCRPLVDIYNNGGFVMCERFGKPIQGLWASIGLCGVVLFFISILLLLTYRWLKTGEDNNRSKASNTKKSRNSQEETNGNRRLGKKKSQNDESMADSTGESPE
uniref:t-SNARE coiled-coil homology domain-containing protein n=1 Tax=Caenorhabditis japonica TaxID=281687 RepID=A0A8R1DJQ8_CAEJA